MVTISGDITPNRSRPLYNAVQKVTFSAEGAEPVELEDVKEHLRIDSGFTADDDFITALITRCRRKLENQLNISLVSRTVEAVMKNELGNVNLPYGPVDSITGAVDDEGDVIDADDYEILDGSLKTVYNYFKVTYTTTAVTDQAIILKLLELIAWHYENRGDQEKPKIAGPWLV